MKQLNDLDLAVKRMKQNNLSMVFSREGKIIFESNKKGLTPFIQAINTLTRDIQEATLADRVVGKAAALLATYARIHSVYASILSFEAIKILEYHRIPFKYGKRVKIIVNHQGTDLCPFEKAVLDTNNPSEAFQCIEEKIQSQKARQ